MAADHRIDYDGEISERYADGRRLSPEAAATWRAAIGPLVPPHSPVLDIGAGTGRFSRLLDELAPGRVVALEPAFGMARWLERGSAVSGAAEALPVRSRSVGLVWSAFTTHYFDLDAAAQEFERVLDRGGEVAIWHAFPFIARSTHRMLIAPDLVALADRLANRSISTLHLISDEEFDAGLAQLRAHATATPPAPVYAPNVLLRFGAA